jgi:hypothetical protein
MAGRLSSPRFRRRLLRVGALVGVAGAATVVAVVFWNTGSSYEAPLSTEPAIVPTQRKSVRLAAGERREVIATAARFVRTAVRRERLHESYDLVSTKLRQGLSRSEWLQGDIPVQPYPVAAARWKLDYSYDHEVGLSVYVVPDTGEQLRPMVFNVSLTRERRGPWLVDSWTPSPSSAPSAEANGRTFSLGDSAPIVPPGGQGRISGVWLLAPVALLFSGFAAVLVHILRQRRLVRRAERAYAASRGTSSPS